MPDKHGKFKGIAVPGAPRMPRVHPKYQPSPLEEAIANGNGRISYYGQTANARAVCQKCGRASVPRPLGVPPVGWERFDNVRIGVRYTCDLCLRDN